MSYKFFSSKPGKEHDIDQWEARSLQGELLAFKGRSLIRYFEQFLTDKKSHVIEGGCGLGAWCEWFQQQGYQVTGIEYDPEIVTRAKMAKPDIAVQLGDITNLSFPDNTFDAYISLGVIEHFEHGPDKAIIEAFRVLKPGGLGFFTTPLLTPIRRMILHPVRSLYFFLQRLRGRKTYFWEYRFTKKELRTYLEQGGFEIIDEGIDDYEPSITNRHLGLWADWFFLRKSGGEIWELNTVGKIILKIFKVIPDDWYCSGYLFVVRANKQ